MYYPKRWLWSIKHTVTFQGHKARDLPHAFTQEIYKREVRENDPAKQQQLQVTSQTRSNENPQPIVSSMDGYDLHISMFNQDNSDIM